MLSMVPGAYARSPGRGHSGKGRLWHTTRADGFTTCARVRTRPASTGGWELTNRLPRRSDAHCRVCFPSHDPGPVEDYRPADWTSHAITTAIRERKT